VSILIGIDVGGTFTDVVGFDTVSATLQTIKVPSTPSDPAIAFIAGLNRLGEEMRLGEGVIERIIHGTTVATNGIIQRRGSRIGILTTSGFEDVLIIGRQKRTEMYDVMMDPETPTFLVDRDRIMGVRERVGSDGTVLVDLDEHDVEAAAQSLLDRGVEAFAVCFLFSFLNPEHERRAADTLRRIAPDVSVSLSSSIDPRFREYERFVLTAFDAYVRPAVGRYIARLTQELSSRGVPVRLHVMQSRGGITSDELILERPVSTVLSGPAAGAIAGAFVGLSAGNPDVISMDIGGTSCDLALIRDGRPMITSEARLENYPLRQPMVDVRTIGAGGGSIAWIDSAGALHVGPQSAGAEPGPACYGKGGSDATVTDASVVLGYIDPRYFAGGDVNIDPDLANKAVAERVADPLKLDLAEAAAGIHRILNARMADEIRLVSVRRGRDPRDFALVSGGGGGGLHAARLARIVGIQRVVVPPAPGLLSAFGLLVADIEHEESGTSLMPLDSLDLDSIRMTFNRLDMACKERMERDAVPVEGISIRHLAELRYRGQSYELEVAVPDAWDGLAAQLTQRFQQAHTAVYGHASEDQPIELVTLRAIHSYEPPKPSSQSPTAGAPRQSPARIHSVYFEETASFLETPLVDRASIGSKGIAGPLLVLQDDSTTLVPPGFVAASDDAGNLILSPMGGPIRLKTWQ
jgi:N-methylhydantoinase A